MDLQPTDLIRGASRGQAHSAKSVPATGGLRFVHPLYACPAIGLLPLYQDDAFHRSMAARIDFEVILRVLVNTAILPSCQSDQSVTALQLAGFDDIQRGEDAHPVQDARSEQGGIFRPSQAIPRWDQIRLDRLRRAERNVPAEPSRALKNRCYACERGRLRRAESWTLSANASASSSSASCPSLSRSIPGLNPKE
jgi:hypothetical protein